VGLCVSHTSREPRSGEREGLHYYFRSREEMVAEIARGGFLEYAEVQLVLHLAPLLASPGPPKRTWSSAGTQTARHTQTCSAWLLHASCHRLRPAHLADKARQFRAPHVLLSCRMLFWCGTTASPLQDRAPWLGSRYARQPGLQHDSPFFRDAKSKLLVYEALSY
jgi:AcrR family transcriptional regulator